MDKSNKHASSLSETLPINSKVQSDYPSECINILCMAWLLCSGNREGDDCINRGRCPSPFPPHPVFLSVVFLHPFLLLPCVLGVIKNFADWCFKILVAQSIAQITYT